FVGCIAIVWGSVTYLYSPVFFWWLTPVLVGLILAAPIVRYSSSITIGKLARRLGIFICPSETKKIPVLEGLADILNSATFDRTIEVDSNSRPAIPALPPEIWRDMPTQSFMEWEPATNTAKQRRPNLAHSRP